MQWNKAIVYPIPKPGDWKLNLSKIRLITLLEIPRKILMKILTNRKAPNGSVLIRKSGPKIRFGPVRIKVFFGPKFSVRSGAVFGL